MHTPPACAEYEALIVRVADGLADEADHGRLAEHVSRCPACQHALAVQREAKAVLASRPPLEASPSFRVRVRDMIEEEQARSLVTLLDFRRWTWRLAPVAAALAIAATVGVTRTTTATEDTALMTETAAQLPVSAAWYSTSLSDSSLLSLMLQANADDQLGTFSEVPR